jgi:hypothetical protein
MVRSFLLLPLLLSCSPMTHSESGSTQEAGEVSSEADTASSWTVLFDGSSTEHFRAFNGEAFPTKGWKVEDGCLHVLAGEGGGDIITLEKYASFDLTLEWKVAPGANSGIIYRVSEDCDTTYMTGPEYQVLDDAGYGKNLDPSTGAAGLYGLYVPEGAKPLPAGSFNQARIVIRGNHVEHWLNGTKVMECELGSADWNERVAKSKFSAWPKFGTVKRGHIALQEHGNDVWFRNIKIRILDDAATR